MKKWIFVVALVAVFVLMLVLPPPAAYARGGFGRGCLPGLCVGGFLGWLLGSHVAVVEPARPYPSHVSPPQGPCYRWEPGYWVQKWNPRLDRYEKVFIREPYLVPCQCP